MRLIHIATAALAAASLTFVACDGSSSSRSAPGASTAAATSGISQTTTSATTAAPTTSGTVASPTSGVTSTGPVSSVPDTEPPLIVLTAPRRGAFTTQGAIDVEGTITDQSGVAYFVINGDPITPAANGTFRHTLALTHGLNVIELEAADPLGQRTRSALSVISGDFLPEASVVTDAVATRLNRPAFDAIERVAAQQLGGTNLSAMIMAQNPLYTGGSGLASANVEATAASFGTPTLDLDPQVGGLFVRTEIPNVDLTVRVSGRVLGIGYSLTTQVTADTARLEGTAVVNVANGQVTTDLQNVNVDLDNFRFDISGVPSFLENLVRNRVRRLIEDQIEGQVRTVLPVEINKAIAGANGPITQTILGRPVTLHMIPVAVTFDADGATVVADGDITMQPLPGLILPTTPGSLATAGALPTFGTTKAFYASINDDFLNRIGHAAWRGGLMNLKIDDAFLQAQPGMPSWLSLDAYLLQIFFPSLVGQVNPLDPIEIEIGTLTPPVFKTKPAPGLLDTGLGELTFSVYVAPTGGVRQLVLEASIQIQVDVAPALSQGKLQLRIAGRPLVRTDVSKMPLARFDPLGIENFVDFIIPPVLQVFAMVWSGYPLPTHPALNLTGVDFLQDGPALDFVTVRGDL
ncbi:MAG: hypothetical protein JKY65_30155 [Planctomycetes bacterium]|nr:hypothetical protein [Planctomycetota bacterium]